MDDDLGFKPKQQADDDLGFQPKESFGTEALNAIKDVAGTAGRAIGYGLSDVINTPVAIANYANQKLAGLFGVKPEDVPTPDLPFNPKIFPLRQGTESYLDPLARGLASGAELAVPAFDLAKGTKALLGSLTGLNANAKATDFIKNLIGNQSKIKEVFQNTYNDIGNLASKKGYNLLPNSTQKPIDSSLFSNQFNGMTFNDRKNVLKNLSPETTDLLKQFNNKPTYETGHLLQSSLGSDGVNLRKSAEGADRYLGGQTLRLRNALNQDINNTFNQYGDTDLFNARKNVTQAYADNENKLLLADKLKSGITNLPTSGLEANAQKIVNAYGKVGFKKLLGKFEAPMKTEASDASIKDLQNSLANRNITMMLSKRLGRPLLWGGLAGLGLEGVHRYL